MAGQFQLPSGGSSLDALSAQMEASKLQQAAMSEAKRATALQLAISAPWLYPEKESGPGVVGVAKVFLDFITNG